MDGQLMTKTCVQIGGYASGLDRMSATVRVRWGRLVARSRDGAGSPVRTLPTRLGWSCGI